jgi:preprotein translocase subunit Sec63
MRGLLIALLILAVLSATQKDLYKILEIERGANEQQIKKAFRRLSAIHHPDKNGGDEKAKDRFIEIQRVDRNNKLGP